MDAKQYKQYSETELGKISQISSLGNLNITKGLLLFSLFQKNHPILEVGSGIGTITKTLLENSKNKIYCYELDDFCIRKLLKLKESNYLGAKKRLHLTSNLIDFAEINFSAIIIDGPINKNDLLKVVQKSSELKLVSVENCRLAQRMWVAKALYKGKFKQQFVEVLHNNRPTTSIFFTNKQTSGGKFHIIFDYILALMRISPKLILYIYKQRGYITYGQKH